MKTPAAPASAARAALARLGAENRLFVIDARRRRVSLGKAADMRGGRRVGAGRKPGSGNRRKSEIAAERALKEATRAAREERAEAREAAAAQRHEERKQARDKRAQDNPGKFEIEILPPLEAIDCPPDCEPLDFLRGLMRNPGLPLGFRQACAVAALPYAHAKPLLGAKEQRRLDAYDDGGDDDMAAALRD